LAFLFRLIPKIGPFKALAFRVPTPEAEKLFLASFDDTMHRYQTLLGEVKENRLQLVNENFDIGKPTRFGEYKMANDSYSKLLERLNGNVPDGLRQNILEFYKNSAGPESVKAKKALETLTQAQ
jgi:hypothetical protein